MTDIDVHTTHQGQHKPEGEHAAAAHTGPGGARAKVDVPRHEDLSRPIDESDLVASARGRSKEANPYAEMISGLIAGDDKTWRGLPEGNVGEKALRFLRDAAKDQGRSISTRKTKSGARAWSVGAEFAPRPRTEG